MNEFLARRAAAHLSFDDLRAVTTDPYGDLAAGRFGALADRELERLGFAAASNRRPKGAVRYRRYCHR